MIGDHNTDSMILHRSKGRVSDFEYALKLIINSAAAVTYFAYLLGQILALRVRAQTYPLFTTKIGFSLRPT